MSRAVSNVDTEFLEDVTAIALNQRDFCEMLADTLDDPAALQLLTVIYHDAEKIKHRAIDQRKYIKERRTQNVRN